jgi:succinate dehydrogenase hydrophobic anchor subunit
MNSNVMAVAVLMWFFGRVWVNARMNLASVFFASVSGVIAIACAVWHLATHLTWVQ